MLVSLRIVAHDRAPNRVANFHRDIRSAFHDDGLVGRRGRLHSGRRAVTIRVSGIAFDDDEIAPVAGRIGECPSHVAIAPGNQRRDAGQRHAGKASRACIAPDHRRAIPDIGRRQSEMHIVRDDRPTVHRQAAGDCPIVAPAGIVVGGWRKPCQQRLGIVCRIFRVFFRGTLLTGLRVLQIWQPRRGAHVKHARIGDGWNAHQSADERCLPGVGRGGHEFGKRRREARVNRREARLALPRGILQSQEHRSEDKRGVLDNPRPWLGAKQEIFGKLDGESTKPRVDPLSVGA